MIQKNLVCGCGYFHTLMLCWSVTCLLFLVLLHTGRSCNKNPDTSSIWTWQQWTVEHTIAVDMDQVWFSAKAKTRKHRADVCLFVCLFVVWRDSPQWAMTSSFTRFLVHTQRRTTVGRTPLDEWSARRRDLYLTIHNTHNKHPCPRWDSNPHSQQASGRIPMP